MEQASGLFVSLRSRAHGTFLSARPDGSAGVSPHCKAGEIFEVVSGASGRRSFRTAQNHFLSAWDDGSYRFQPHCKAWEHFYYDVPEDVDVRKSGAMNLRTTHNTYIAVSADGELTTP